MGNLINLCAQNRIKHQHYYEFLMGRNLGLDTCANLPNLSDGNNNNKLDMLSPYEVLLILYILI